MENFELPSPKVVRIANPVGFIAQKTLIYYKRSADDQAKDILYIHDTLQVFGARLDDLRDEWTGRIRRAMHPKAAKTVETAPEWLFGEVTDVIRQAASIAADRTLSAEALRESCCYGLLQVTR